MPDLIQHDIQAQADGRVVRNPISIQNQGQNIIITANQSDVFVCPIVRFRGRIVDSANQANTLFDFSGNNGIEFAVRVAGFSATQHRDLAERIGLMIMRMRAGLE